MSDTELLYLEDLHVGRKFRSGTHAVDAQQIKSFAAEFDSSKAIDFSGVVTKVEWMNPHVYFYVDVKDADGKVA